MERKVNLCNPINYGGKRSQPIKYIVIHYTGNDGDTDEANAAYFARENTGKTSAHWFVDDDSSTLSVPEEYVAYHCGANYYYHPECRNSNSIGVELCDTRRDGKYGFTEETIDNAIELVRELMQKYNVPVENVVRHYDITHKICPAPFCGNGQAAWDEFKARLTAPETTEEEDMVRYNTVAEMPEYYRAEAQALIDAGALRGDADGKLNVTEDMLRCMIISKRYQDALLTGADTKPSGWAEDELAEAVSVGITDGSRPRGYATREEAAIMVKRASYGNIEELGG